MPVVCLRCPPTCSSAAFWTEDTHDGGARQTAGHPARFTDLTTAGESLHAPVRVGMEDVRARAKPRLSTVRPISRLTRARTSSINLSSPFQSPPLKMRRPILVESGVMNPIIQLSLLNSIANKHRTVSPCVAAGRLLTVRTVIRRSYALVVGLHRNGITRPAAPA